MLGDNVSAIRQQNKMTQQELADKLDISRVYLSRIENNRDIPSDELTGRIADALGVERELIESSASHDVTDPIIIELVRLTQNKRILWDKIELELIAERMFYGDVLKIFKDHYTEYINTYGGVPLESVDKNKLFMYSGSADTDSYYFFVCDYNHPTEQSSQTVEDNQSDAETETPETFAILCVRPIIKNFDDEYTFLCSSDEHTGLFELYSSIIAQLENIDLKIALYRRLRDI